MKMLLKQNLEKPDIFHFLTVPVLCGYDQFSNGSAGLLL